MLSAFTARPIVELKPKEKGKIESLLSYGDRLLVGLSTGALRVYRITELNADYSPAATGATSPTATVSSQQPTREAAALDAEHERFARAKVEQLALIKEAHLLVALAGGVVAIHNLTTLELQDTLLKTKGAAGFAVTSNIARDDDEDEDGGVPAIVTRLAVAVKRRLLLWSWRDAELVDANPEWTLATGIRSLTWITGTRLVAGLAAGYVLVDVRTGDVTEIDGPGSIGGGAGPDAGRFSAGMGYMGMGGMAPKPLATRLAEGEVLLAKDVNTHFIDTEGKSLNRKQIPWPVAPEAIGYSYPFLLALQPSKGVLEVRNPQTLGALQAISLPQATILHVPNPYVRLAHAGKGFLVASDKCIWRMDASGYDAQISSLIANERYEEAISLLNLLEDALLSDKEGKLREARYLKGRELFDRRHYRGALDEFTKASAPPESVISLFPPQISGGPDNSETSASVRMSQSRHSGSTGKDDEHQSAGSKAMSTTQETDRSSLTEDTISIFSSSMQSSTTKLNLEGAELRKATIELQGFLADSRTKVIQRFVNFDGSLKLDSGEDPSEKQAQGEKLIPPRSADDDRPYHARLLDTARLVDTTLFRAYMLTSPTLAGSLFRLPNFCDPTVVREKLAASERYPELIDFFYGKQLHREALEMLRELGQSKHNSRIPEQLRGIGRTVAYLQNLDPSLIDLILEFADWPIRKDPGLSMEIFVADSENAENLPKHEVLDFLGKIDPSLETQYLEHIIHELNDTTPEFHQRLLNRYLEAIKVAKKDHKQGARELLDKLVAFLKSSKNFEPWRFLNVLPKDDADFYEARAITLGCLGQHRQALSIYVFDMHDPLKAEDYCNQTYMAETTAQTTPDPSQDTGSAGGGESSIYQDLLSLYLAPPPPHEPQWENGLELLAKHGPRVPATDALNLLPDVLQVQKMQKYFTTRMRTAKSDLFATRVTAGLRKTLDDNSQAQLRLRSRNRNVLISEDRVCGVCHKRFGGSAIKVMPDNSVVHYGCAVRG